MKVVKGIVVQSPFLFKEILEAVRFTTSLLKSMQMIVMGKYVIIECRDRESIIEVFLLRLGPPINVFWMNENHIAASTF
jgi:hypothetical protein